MSKKNPYNKQVKENKILNDPMQQEQTYAKMVTSTFILMISPEECQMKSFGKKNLLLHVITRNYE